MTTVMCILFSALIVLVLGSVWIGINSIWAVERRVNNIGDDISEVKRNVTVLKAVNDYLLRELHLYAQWDYGTKRYLIVPVCNECYRTHNYPGPNCSKCIGCHPIRLGLSEKEIESFKMKLDEIDRHVINKV